MTFVANVASGVCSDSSPQQVLLNLVLVHITERGLVHGGEALVLSELRATNLQLWWSGVAKRRGASSSQLSFCPPHLHVLPVPPFAFSPLVCSPLLFPPLSISSFPVMSLCWQDQHLIRGNPLPLCYLEIAGLTAHRLCPSFHLASLAPNSNKRAYDINCSQGPYADASTKLYQTILVYTYDMVLYRAQNTVENGQSEAHAFILQKTRLLHGVRVN